MSHCDNFSWVCCSFFLKKKTCKIFYVFLSFLFSFSFPSLSLHFFPQYDKTSSPLCQLEEEKKRSLRLSVWRGRQREKWHHYTREESSRDSGKKLFSNMYVAQQYKVEQETRKKMFPLFELFFLKKKKILSINLWLCPKRADVFFFLWSFSISISFFFSQKNGAPVSFFFFPTSKEHHGGTREEEEEEEKKNFFFPISMKYLAVRQNPSKKKKLNRARFPNFHATSVTSCRNFILVSVGFSPPRRPPPPPPPPPRPPPGAAPAGAGPRLRLQAQRGA